MISTYESTYKPKNVVWRVAENFECEPGYIAAGKIIRNGKIGKVFNFNLAAVNKMDKDSKWYKTPWRTIPDYQGGFVLDGGVHSAAILRGVLPSPMTHLTGFASLNIDWLLPTDTVTALIKTEDGAFGTFEISFAAPISSLRLKKAGIVITGSKGWVEIGNATNGKGVGVIRTTVHLPGKDNQNDEIETIDEPSCGVEKEIESFVNFIVGNDDGNGWGEPREALKDVALIQATLNSNGVLVDLTNME